MCLRLTATKNFGLGGLKSVLVNKEARLWAIQDQDIHRVKWLDDMVNLKL